jgi:hypothetical protein
MSDDDSTEAQPEAAALDPVPASGATAPAAERSGVQVPGWLAGALVVVLALVVGGVGFAIGRSTADDGGVGFRPALVRSAQRNGGPGANQFPGGPGGQGPNQFPGGPGGQRGPGGQGGPGGQRGDQGQSPNGGGRQDGGPQDGGPQDGGSQNGGSQSDGSSPGGA